MRGTCDHALLGGMQVLRQILGRYDLEVVYMLFFFFQAEDGIRDYKVTGVQTCALPICGAYAAAGAGDDGDSVLQWRMGELHHSEIRGARPCRALAGPWLIGYSDCFQRSEERRVGKEGRSRWSPDH